MLTLKTLKPWTAPFAIVFCATLVAWIVSGCSSQDAGSAGASPSTQPMMASASDATRKSGNQLWVENCSRCHNLRPPQYYSDAQWGITAHHMRVRANLTGEEQREITKFLQASN